MKKSPRKCVRAPTRLQAVVALLDVKSRCVHCKARLVTNRDPEALRSAVSVSKNAIGDLIAWRTCPTCRKVSPLKLNPTPIA